jgi:hypothetical protein
MNIAEDAIRLIKAESERSKVPESIIHGRRKRADGVIARRRIWAELTAMGYHDADIAAAFGRTECTVRHAREKAKREGEAK